MTGLLHPTTDWTRQTAEERAEHCVSFLTTHGLMKVQASNLALRKIRAMADLQRDERARAA